MYEQISKHNFKTPVYKLTLDFFKKININLFIKRDDLYPISGGGNKGRKLHYIINENNVDKYDALVTTGGNQSNHIRASLIRAKELRWKSHIIIHDNKPTGEIKGNLKISELLADKITYVNMKNVGEAMDKAVVEFKKQGYRPLYIWGGGHCLEGSLAYHNAVVELKNQLINVEPDYIFLASGTGATQAGLISGAKLCFKDCKVIGISVARNKNKGEIEIYKSLKELEKYFKVNKCKKEDVIFDDSYAGGGYGNYYKDLDETIYELANNGVLLDKTYTAKAFYGMMDYIKKGKLKPNSNVVFWHTGGLLNLISQSIN